MTAGPREGFTQPPFRLMAMLLSVLSGAACNSLWVRDAPRPTLKGEDQFTVVPVCPDLIIDSTSVATVQRLITLTGRRFETNLGAESVPVQVHIGSCCSTGSPRPPAPDASGPPDGDFSADADAPSDDVTTDVDAPPPGRSLIRASAAADASGEAGGVCAASTQAEACSLDFDPFDVRAASAFELVAPQQFGCRQRSPSQLDCILDPNGEAAFAVRGTLDDRASLIPEYLPICITPAMVDDKCSKQREVRVIPHSGTARFTLAVVKLPGGDTAPPVAGNGSCSNILDCNRLRPRAQFLAGVVSTDIPAVAIRTSDFLDVKRDISLSIALTTLTQLTGNARAFLSLDQTCQTVDGGAAKSFSVAVEKGHRESATFFLCAPSEEASYRLVPGAATDIRAVDGGGPPATGASSPLLGPSLEFSVAALTEGYVVQPSGGQDVLFVRQCGGQLARAQASALRTIAPPLTLINGAIVVAPCPGPGPRSTADAANDIQDVDVEGADIQDAYIEDADVQEAGASTCRPFTLELNAGGTCRLD